MFLKMLSWGQHFLDQHVEASFQMIAARRAATGIHGRRRRRRRDSREEKGGVRI
jgi:hypothetical protein